jgi:hypothetical protein
MEAHKVWCKGDGEGAEAMEGLLGAKKIRNILR